MAREDLNGAGAPLRDSVDKTPHDHLLLPGGSRVGDVKNIATILVKIDVPGVSHSNGRAANIEAYAQHIASIYDAGGKAAVNAWLASKV